MLFEKIIERFGSDLSGLTFGLWGLAFKPGTDDMREAPAVVLLHELIGAGARVKAYDPEAMEVARRELPRAWFETGALQLTRHQYDALEGVRRHGSGDRVETLSASRFQGHEEPDEGPVHLRRPQPVRPAAAEG